VAFIQVLSRQRQWPNLPNKGPDRRIAVVVGYSLAGSYHRFNPKTSVGELNFLNPMLFPAVSLSSGTISRHRVQSAHLL
jgi:hypothetical protein